MVLSPARTVEYKPQEIKNRKHIAERTSFKRALRPYPENEKRGEYIASSGGWERGLQKDILARVNEAVGAINRGK